MKLKLKDVGLDMPIQHLGYDNKEQMIGRQHRNTKIFEKHPRLWKKDSVRKLQYARGLREIGRPKEAAELFREIATHKKYKKDLMRIYACANLAEILETDQAIEIWESIFPEFPRNIMMLFTGARLMMTDNQIIRAKELFIQVLICEIFVGPFPLNYKWMREVATKNLRRIYKWKEPHFSELGPIGAFNKGMLDFLDKMKENPDTKIDQKIESIAPGLRITKS